MGTIVNFRSRLYCLCRTNKCIVRVVHLSSGLYHFFRNNFLLLGLILLTIWLLIVWNTIRESEKFSAYATFGTALATLALAVATTVMASLNRKQIRQNTALIDQNRQLVEHNRIAVWRPYYVELIACVLEPLLQGTKSLVSAHRNKSYSWASKHEVELGGYLPNGIDSELFRIGSSKDFYLPTIHFSLKSSATGLNETRYSDLLQANDRLRYSIGDYEKRVGDFGKLFVGLAERMLSGDLKMKQRTEKNVQRRIVKGQAGYEEELERDTLCCVEGLLRAFLGCPRHYGSQRITDFLERHSHSLMQELMTKEGMVHERERVCSVADSLVALLEDIEEQAEGIADKYRRDFGITEEMISIAREALR